MGVEFQEENVPTPTRRAAPNAGITQFLIAKGIAKDVDEANRILLFVLVVAVAGIAYFLFFSGPSKNLPPPLPEPISQAAAGLNA